MHEEATERDQRWPPAIDDYGIAFWQALTNAKDWHATHCAVRGRQPTGVRYTRQRLGKCGDRAAVVDAVTQVFGGVWECGTWLPSGQNGGWVRLALFGFG